MAGCAWGSLPGQSREGRQTFFFEKKNQKTFVYLGSVLSPACRTIGNSREIKVFCFFFSKKKCLPAFTGLPRSPAARVLSSGFSTR
jgi:hypothetical protein